MHNLLERVRDACLSRENAEKLLHTAIDHSLMVDWLETTPPLMFNFLWSLINARCQLSDTDPRECIPGQLRDEAFGILHNIMRKNKFQNIEKINLFRLIGLLLFMDMEKTQRLKSIVTAKLTGLDYLCDEIEMGLNHNRLGFIGAFYALYAMGLVRDPRGNFTPEINAALEKSYLKFKTPTKAAAHLYAYFCRIAHLDRDQT
jgi:hypothetical protein